LFRALSKDVFSIQQHSASHGTMTNDDELERIWKEAVVAYSKYYPGICLQGLGKTTRNLGLDSTCLLQDSNRVPPEYKVIQGYLT
jgi:hypothetical protein